MSLYLLIRGYLCEHIFEYNCVLHQAIHFESGFKLIMMHVALAFFYHNSNRDKIAIKLLFFGV